MNNLKKVALACALFAITLSVSAQTSETIEVSIKSRISSNELEQIKLDLAENEIELVVLDAEFVCDQLTYIDFKVVYNNRDRVGMTTNNFSKGRSILLTAKPRPDGTYGFRVEGKS